MLLTTQGSHFVVHTPCTGGDTPSQWQLRMVVMTQVGIRVSSDQSAGFRRDMYSIQRSRALQGYLTAVKHADHHQGVFLGLQWKAEEHSVT